jgi:hypothetical protein
MGLIRKIGVVIVKMPTNEKFDKKNQTTYINITVMFDNKKDQ